jgi:hypothetical protein
MKTLRSVCVAAALPFAPLLLGGCSAEDDGAISVRAYGESFIEDGIPASAMADGWSVKFARFDVQLEDIVVAGTALSTPDPVDVSEASGGDGHELGKVTVKTGDYTEPSFTIGRVRVVGSAEKDDVTKSFDWTFRTRTVYQRCETTTMVSEAATSTFQITVHADHLFYDSLVADDPQLLFQPLADADADADAVITEAELAATDIGSYDPGNEDVSDLWSWLVAQHRTLGHVDGEGHCRAVIAD